MIPDMTGYSVKLLPRKYCRKQTPRDDLRDMCARDRIIVAAVSVATYREIGAALKMSPMSISRIIKKVRYIR